MDHAFSVRQRKTNIAVTSSQADTIPALCWALTTFESIKQANNYFLLVQALFTGNPCEIPEKKIIVFYLSD